MHKIFSRCCLIPLSSIFLNIFVAMGIKLIQLWFFLLVRSPFFGICKIAALRQMFGASPELKTWLKTFSRCSKSAPDFVTSVGMLSSPVALPDKVLLIAGISSSIVNSWTGIGNVSEMIVSISSGCGGRDAGLPGRFLKCPSNSLLLSDGLSPDGLAA